MSPASSAMRIRRFWASASNDYGRGEELGLLSYVAARGFCSRKESEREKEEKGGGVV